MLTVGCKNGKNQVLVCNHAKRECNPCKRYGINSTRDNIQCNALITYTCGDAMPTLPNGRVGFFVHRVQSENQQIKRLRLHVITQSVNVIRFLRYVINSTRDNIQCNALITYTCGDAIPTLPNGRVGYFCAKSTRRVSTNQALSLVCNHARRECNPRKRYGINSTRDNIQRKALIPYTFGDTIPTLQNGRVGYFCA